MIESRARKDHSIEQIRTKTSFGSASQTAKHPAGRRPMPVNPIIRPPICGRCNDGLLLYVIGNVTDKCRIQDRKDTDRIIPPPRSHYSPLVPAIAALCLHVP